MLHAGARMGIRASAANGVIAVVPTGIGMSPPYSNVALKRPRNVKSGLVANRMYSGLTKLYCSDPKCQPDFGTCGGGT